MAINRFRARALPLVASLATLVSFPLAGQEANMTENSETAGQTDYWHEQTDEGVVFTQSLKWESVKYCPYYDITIQRQEKKNDAWANVHESRVEGSELAIRLSPGEYRYRLVVYDVLERPSLTSEWFPFTVIRALQPRVGDITPGVIYFEEENSDVFAVDGANLLESSTVTFRPIDGKGKTYKGSVLEADKRGRDMRVSFPIGSINVGEYGLHVENPGGLTTTSKPVTFKYIKPMDFDVSIGYMPTVVLWDGTIDRYFESSFIPIGIVAKATFIPFKRASGFYGVGLFASASRISNDTEFYELTMNWAMAHLVFAYQRPIVKNKLVFACHIGPGYTVFYDVQFAFKNGVTSPAFSPSSMSALAGLSLQYYFRKRMYADLSTDCTYVFMKDMQVFSIHPSLSVGWQF